VCECGWIDVAVQNEQGVTVISHNNLLFVLCTKCHTMGAYLCMRNTFLAGNSEEKRPIGRSRRRWDHSIKLDVDEFMRLRIYETMTVMRGVETGICALSSDCQLL